jgi:transcriptional regulator with XRE-family HTH domain
MNPAALPEEPKGCPTYDQVYDQFLKKLFEKRSLKNPDFEEAVRQRFWEEPPRLCSQAIGKWIEDELQQRGWKQQDLAVRLGLDPSAVNYWIGGGNMALPYLARVLLEFESQWSTLPIPARQELALQSYLVAMSLSRERLEPAGGSQALDRERFWCLFHLFSEPSWERAVRSKDEDLLRKEAGRIHDAAHSSLGNGTGYVADLDNLAQITRVDGLQRLVREWGMAWLVCVGFILNRWDVQ